MHMIYDPFAPRWRIILGEKLFVWIPPVNWGLFSLPMLNSEIQYMNKAYVFLFSSRSLGKLGHKLV